MPSSSCPMGRPKLLLLFGQFSLTSVFSFSFPRTLSIKSQEINTEHKDSNDFYMTHMLFNIEFDQCHSTFYKDYKIILDKLKAKSLMRMKINLYPRTENIEVHEQHYDYDYEHKGCLFSFNTCNGGTILEDGTKIDSVANRALLFDPSKLHSSTSCTDDKVRLNMNINYF